MSQVRHGKLAFSAFGPDIESPADEIVDAAWDGKTPAAMCKLARAALDIDLDALDAYNILGIHSLTQGERIALFREAVVVGRTLFGPLFGNDDIAWWGYIGTRPWLRALQNLGIALLDAGDLRGAAEAFQELLTLNPNDNQGARYVLMRIRAEAGDYVACKKLLSQYADDSSIEFIATKLLMALAKGQNENQLSRIVTEIEASNAYLLPALKKSVKSGKWPSPLRPDYRTRGSKDEASDYLAEFKQAWLNKPKALERLQTLL